MAENQRSKPHLPSLLLALAIGVALGVAGAWIFSSGGLGGGDPVVARYNGTNLRASEAFGSVKTRLFDLEEEVYRTKEQAIMEAVEQRLIESEARKQNLSVEQLLEKETGGDVGEVSDKDITDFLSSKNLSLDDPRIKKDDVREYLKYRRRFDKRQNFVASLKKNADVKLYIKEPESPKLIVDTDGYPSWGAAKAPVTVIEFSDFECPYCGQAVGVVNQIKKEYGPDKVRLVFRDMPLPMHNRAVPAALASHCANEQGKFWEMHDLLFANRASLQDEDLKKYAKELKLDTAKFNDCYDKKKYLSTVEKSRREAESLGIQATPSFVVNGRLVQGAQSFEKFKAQIDKGLK